MKKVVFFSVLCSLLLASCVKINLGNGSKIEPIGKIVKHEYRLASFNQVDVDVVANVKLIQSKSGDSRVVLSCPENYVELFKFDVNQGKSQLDISFTRDNANIEAQNVDITVYTPALRKLESSGVASVEIDKLNATELSVDNSGVGSMYLYGLSVGKLVVDCSGVGNIELKGVADKVELDCSGGGSIKAEDLKAKEVKAEVSGVGGIRCYASERIDGEVSGVGSLKFGGNPQKKQLERNGIGDISEL